MTMDTSFREPRLDPPEPKVIHQCSWCDEPIYDGEECYDMNPHGWCCKYCMESKRTTAEVEDYYDG